MLSTEIVGYPIPWVAKPAASYISRPYSSGCNKAGVAKPALCMSRIS